MTGLAASAERHSGVLWRRTSAGIQVMEQRQFQGLSRGVSQGEMPVRRIGCGLRGSD